MRVALQKFYVFLEQPLFLSARPVLVASCLLLGVAFFSPLWRIEMVAPQYRNGLSIDIYAHTIKGGHDGADINEINVLNHYIGMRKLDRAELSDLDWIPFAIGVLALLTLRVAAIGNVRALLDLIVITGYFSAFSMARFVYRLYIYGHNLSPDAPVKVEGFTPAIIGSKQIANFTTTSLPGGGTFAMGAFALVVGAVTVWHLWAGKRAAG
ncbi:MAG: hypothetical protein IT381_08630 [Deltaproteobacteria bacterium]|nr:hypothetical protein [Deltaproteobacteria bacterium]